jgi:hypothetical protein
MKTINEIKEQIVKLSEVDKKKDPQTYKKNQTEVAFTRLCLMYLESNPHEDFLRKQYNEIKMRLDKIENGYLDWKKGEIRLDLTDQELRIIYNRKMEKTKYDKQFRIFDYILN